MLITLHVKTAETAQNQIRFREMSTIVEGKCVIYAFVKS